MHINISQRHMSSFIQIRVCLQTSQCNVYNTNSDSLMAPFRFGGCFWVCIRTARYKSDLKVTDNQRNLTTSLCQIKEN